MNTLTTQSGAEFTSALSGEAPNEARALASWEVDEVSGGGQLLFAIGGVLLVGLICLDYGEELSAASVKLAEWIRG